MQATTLYKGVATLVDRAAFDAALGSRFDDALTLVRDELVVVHDSMLMNASAVSSMLAGLTAALRGAAADAPGSPNPPATGAPRVSATGAGISLSAPEAFGLHTNRSVVDDVCSVASVAEQLQVALGAL